MAMTVGDFKKLTSEVSDETEIKVYGDDVETQMQIVSLDYVQKFATPSSKDPSTPLKNINLVILELDY